MTSKPVSKVIRDMREHADYIIGMKNEFPDGHDDLIHAFDRADTLFCAENVKRLLDHISTIEQQRETMHSIEYVQSIISLSAEWERKAISNFEQCSQMSQRITELEQQLAAERANAERWKFMRQFLSVEDVGSDVPMSTVVIHECAFDTAMVGVDCHLSVDEAFDASRAVAADLPVEGE